MADYPEYRMLPYQQPSPLAIPPPTAQPPGQNWNLPPQPAPSNGSATGMGSLMQARYDADAQRQYQAALAARQSDAAAMREGHGASLTPPAAPAPVTNMSPVAAAWDPASARSSMNYGGPMPGVSSQAMIPAATQAPAPPATPPSVYQGVAGLHLPAYKPGAGTAPIPALPDQTKSPGPTTAAPASPAPQAGRQAQSQASPMSATPALSSGKLKAGQVLDDASGSSMQGGTPIAAGESVPTDAEQQLNTKKQGPYSDRYYTGLNSYIAQLGGRGARGNDGKLGATFSDGRTRAQVEDDYARAYFKANPKEDVTGAYTTNPTPQSVHGGDAPHELQRPGLPGAPPGQGYLDGPRASSTFGSGTSGGGSGVQGSVGYSNNAGHAKNGSFGFASEGAVSNFLNSGPNAQAWNVNANDATALAQHNTNDEIMQAHQGVPQSARPASPTLQQDAGTSAAFGAYNTDRRANNGATDLPGSQGAGRPNPSTYQPDPSDLTDPAKKIPQAKPFDQSMYA